MPTKLPKMLVFLLLMCFSNLLCLPGLNAAALKSADKFQLAQLEKSDSILLKDGETHKGFQGQGRFKRGYYNSRQGYPDVIIPHHPHPFKMDDDDDDVIPHGPHAHHGHNHHYHGGFPMVHTYSYHHRPMSSYHRHNERWNGHNPHYHHHHHHDHDDSDDCEYDSSFEDDDFENKHEESSTKFESIVPTTFPAPRTTSETATQETSTFFSTLTETTTSDSAIPDIYLRFKEKN